MACFDAWDIGACGCSPACAVTITGTVKGCNNKVLPGVTVKAYQPNTSGTLLATTTTDGSGNFTITADSTNGLVKSSNIVMQFSKARFTTATSALGYSAGVHSSSFWSCGTTPSALATKTLAVAAGYICIFGCADPTVTTLYLTDSVIGNTTLSWNGTVWTGSHSYNKPACRGCVASTFPVNYAYSTGITLTVTYATNFSGCPGLPPSGIAGPIATGTTSYTLASCAPYAATFTQDMATASPVILDIYCMSSGTVNYAISE